MPDNAPILVKAEEAADHIFKIANASKVETRIKAGSYLVTEVFNSDILGFYKRSDTTPYMIDVARILKKRECDDFDTDEKLLIAIHTWEQDKALGGLLAQWPTLSATHFQRVQSLQPEDQRRLLDLAAKEGWSTDRLLQESLALKKQKGTHREPKPEAVAKRALARVVDAVDNPTELSAALIAGGIPQEQISDLVAKLGTVNESAKAMLAQLASKGAGAEAASEAAPQR